MALYVLAVVLPLIPAVVIYWLFPNTPVTTSGALSGVTFKAGGAFAAYVVVFLLTAVSWNKTFGSLHSLISETWTVKGVLQIEDANGNKVTDQSGALQNLQVSFDPDFTHSSGSHFRITAPEINGQIPQLRFSIPNGGGGSDSIDFSDPDEFKITKDDAHNLIIVTTPVTITLSPAQHPYGLNKVQQPLPPSETRPLLQLSNG